MAVVRTAVLLVAWSTGQVPMQMPDREFYRRYFFDLGSGQAAYWAKQTDRQVVLDGDVFDWAVVRDDNPDLSSRSGAVEFAMSALERDRGVDFDRYDMVLLIESANPGVASDGGATTVRGRPAVAIRVGDGFDFCAHEIGHCLGLQHSFGDPFFHALGVAQGGEYGHPYCVMSAQAYGGKATPWDPPPPREPEYRFQGPSLNAAAALSRGWVGAYDYPLPGAQPAEFTVRGRHFLGPRAVLPAQAINVRAASGENYVVEFRENQGWDRGQGTPRVIVNQGIGSTADTKYPGTASATFLGQIALPFTLGGAGGRFQHQGFGVQLVDYDPADSQVTLKVYPGAAPVSVFSLTKSVAADEKTVSTGETAFGDGEIVCVQGVWRYTEVVRTQVATFDCTYDLARPSAAVTWRIDGTVVSGDGTHSEFRDVVLADPRLQRKKEKRVVALDHHVEALPTGSRLTVRSGPANETVTVTVSAVMTTPFGANDEAAQVTFEGHEFVYPPEFEKDRWACLTRRLRDRFPKYKVLFPPDGWTLPDPEPGFDPRELVHGLETFLERDDRRSFEQGLAELERRTGIDRALIEVVETADRVELARPEPQAEIRLPDLAAPEPLTETS